jgi:glycosyltransferase involved in cell wall biosynthesis
MRLVQKADAIIAVSEHTKQDLIKLGEPNTDPDRIYVIYRGNPFEYQVDDVIPRDILPATYLLFVGRRSTCKNFQFFISAVVPLLKKDTELNICCTGGGTFSRDERKMMMEIPAFPFTAFTISNQKQMER